MCPTDRGCRSCEKIDKNLGPLDSQGMSDSDTYTLVRIGQHSAVIACFPAEQYSNIFAPRSQLTCSALRVGLMVGVRGGIRSNTHDIREYDMGKFGSGGSFIELGNLPPQSYPPTKTKPDPTNKGFVGAHPDSPH